MNLSELYKRLELHSDFSKGNNSELFLDTVDEIVLHRDKTSIGILLQQFDDNSEYNWVLESIACALEYYPSQTYVPEFIKTIPWLIMKAPNWLVTLTYPIFNTADALEYFKHNIRLITKQDLIGFLDLVSSMSERHSKVCDELKMLI